MTINPTSSQSGSASITITLNDNGITSSESFDITILSLFSENNSCSFTGVEKGSVAFGDYDNDGDLDLLLTGYSNAGIAALYKNTAGNYNEITNINLPGVYDGSVTFGDFDNDADLDILITGNNGPSIAKIYENVAGNYSEFTGINLTGVKYSDAEFGDYDNDGDLDILLTGYSSQNFARIYKNTNGLFSEYTSIYITGVYYSDVEFGDYDNDSDLDIIITGLSTDTTYVTKIYENISGAFSVGVYLTDVANSSVEFGDFDNDGDLDILLSGDKYTNYINQFGENQMISDGLISEPQRGTIYASLRNGISTTDSFILQGSFDDLTISVSEGESAYSIAYKVNQYSLTTGIKSKSVTYAKLDGLTKIGNIQFTLYGKASAEISTVISSINDLETLVIAINEKSDETRIIADLCDNKSAIILCNDEGYDIGIEDFIVIDAFPAVIYFSGLKSDGITTIINTTIVSEFQDSAIVGGHLILTSGSSFSITSNAGSALFNSTYQNSAALDPNSAKITKIFKNTSGSYTEYTNIVLTGVDECSASFADIDNDGDLDIMLFGYTVSNTRLAKLFLNDSGNFSEYTSFNLPGVRLSASALGDYDNDGDLDIFLTGQTSSGKIAKLFTNNITTSNTSPSQPTSLSAIVTENDVVLSWSASSDAQTTSSAGLNYNLKMGSTPGGVDILSPMALPLNNGYRLIPEKGMFQNLTATVQDLKNDTYYWSVQAIDTAFAGSSFSQEYSFTIEIPPEISNISNHITSEDTTIHAITFMITDTNASASNLTLTIHSSDTSLIPSQNISYTCHSQSYTISITPAENQYGTATITVMAINSDQLTASTFFNLTVTSVNDPPSFVMFPNIAAGINHSIALKADGTVWTWGDNQYGQLGNGTTTDSTTPVQVSSITNVYAVSSGANFNLALKTDGTVWAWGDNQSGQLGNGGTETKYKPTQVLSQGGGDFNNVIDISCGRSHSLAVKSDGSVWAWGKNTLGNLGDNTTDLRTYPTQVLGVGGVGSLHNIAYVEAGNNHSIALSYSGTVYTWGNNEFGQLGNGTTGSYQTTPILIQNFSYIKAISAGKDHSVALKTDGNIWTWGFNENGELGHGHITNLSSPERVTALTSVVMISAGNNTTAIKSDGTGWGTGLNTSGQLGNGNNTNQYSPIQLSNVDDIRSIACGNDHIILMRKNGDTYASGKNDYGQLGNNEKIDRNTSDQVHGFLNVYYLDLLTVNKNQPFTAIRFLASKC